MSSTNTPATGASAGAKAGGTFQQLKNASEGLRQGINNFADEAIKPREERSAHTGTTSGAPPLGSAPGSHAHSAPGPSTAHGTSSAPGAAPPQSFGDGTPGFKSGRTPQTHETVEQPRSGSGAQISEDAKRLGTGIMDAVKGAGKK